MIHEILSFLKKLTGPIGARLLTAVKVNTSPSTRYVTFYVLFLRKEPEFRLRSGFEAP
jgi:hypothetical protein